MNEIWGEGEVNGCLGGADLTSLLKVYLSQKGKKIF